MSSTSKQGPAVHRRIEIEGVRVHYRVAGRGRGGVPVVCIAAPGDSSGSMVPLVRRLGERQLAFALDLPGQGRSGNPPHGRRDPAWWLLTWLERLRFEHCHLITAGDSIGVAIDAAQKSQRFVRSLTVLAPPPLRRHGVLKEAASTLAGTTHVPRHPRMLGSVAARLRSQAARDFNKAMAPRNLASDLRHVTVPVIVVRGENDTHVTRDESAALARAARGTFIELPGAPRSSQLSHAHPIGGTLERFWTSIEEGRLDVTDSGEGEQWTVERGEHSQGGTP